MSTRAFVVAGVVAAGLGVGIGWYATSRSVFRAAGPNAEMVPDTVVAWMQVDGLTPVWNQMARTDAWSDLRSSALLKAFGNSPTGQAWNDLAGRIESKAGYGLDAARTMRLVGTSVSVGIEEAPAAGEPAWIVLAKLDVTGLVGDVLAGKGDWRDLHAEFERRTAAMEFDIRRTEHLGFAITTASRGEVVFHAALLGDTLAVSDSDDLLRRTITVHDAGGQGSLGRTARFRDEIARATGPGIATHWIDLERGRRGIDRWKTWLNRLDRTGAAAGLAERIVHGCPGAPALVMRGDLPGGDLYAARWSFSRTAAELAGASAPSDLAAVTGSGFALAEVRDAGRVAAAWEASALRKRLADGPLGRKIRAWFDDPASARDALGRSFFGNALGLPNPDFEDFLDEEDSGNRAKKTASLEMADRFGVRMAMSVGREALAGSLSGHAAVAVHRGDGRVPVGCAATGLGAQGYLLALAAEGAALGRGELVAATHAGHTFYRPKRTGSGEADAHWTHVGDALVIASHADALRAAIDRAVAAGAGAAPPAKAGAALADDGWVMRVRADGKGMLGAIRDGGGSEVADQIGKQWFETAEVRVHVDERFAQLEMRSEVAYSADQPTRKATTPRPRAWDVLPERTVLAAGATIDLRAMVELFFASLGPADPEAIDRTLAEASEAIGVDIRKDLLGALGPEIALGVVERVAPPEQDGEPVPFLPGIVFALDVRDEAVARRAFDGVVGAIEKSLGESARGRRRASARVYRETVGRTTVVRVEPDPPEQPRIVPTFSLGDGRILVGLDTEAVDESLDAASGRAPSFGASEFMKRVTKHLPEAGDQWAVLDWGRAVGLVEQYAPVLARTFPADELPDGRRRPEFPVTTEELTEEVWEKHEREVAEWEKAAEQHSVPRMKEWIGAFRVIDFMASSTVTEGRTARSRFVVRFLE